MPASISSTSVLQAVARSLVARQKSPNIEAALSEIALGVIKQKISYYRRRIRSFERKHKMGFDDFTASLQGRATPIEEDDWLEWQAAKGMLADWQQTYEELTHHAVH